jgi:hypothetical protein
MLRQRIGLRGIGSRVQPASLEQANDPARDPTRHARDLLGVRRR